MEQRVLTFAHESEVNNRICKACYTKNLKLLKQRSLNNVPQERVELGNKRARDVGSQMTQKVAEQRQATDGLTSLFAAAHDEEVDDVEGKLERSLQIFFFFPAFCLQIAQMWIHTQKETV